MMVRLLAGREGCLPRIDIEKNPKNWGQASGSSSYKQKNTARQEEKRGGVPSGGSNGLFASRHWDSQRESSLSRRSNCRKSCQRMQRYSGRKLVIIRKEMGKVDDLSEKSLPWVRQPLGLRSKVMKGKIGLQNTWQKKE